MGQPDFANLVEETLTESATKRRGLFRWAAVETLVGSVGHRDFLYGKQVFALVALELWFQMFVDRTRSP